MKLEILQKDHFYHIYNRGINGCNIFTTDANKKYFLELYQKYIGTKVSTFSYCLLSNHFHIVFRVESDPKVLTQSLSNLFNSYAKAYNKAEIRTGSLFEKHFKRIQLTDENHLKQIIIYVHLNPQMHFGFDYKTFPFSSYRAFLSEHPTKVNRSEVLALFEDKENFIYVHKDRNAGIDEQFTLE